MAEERATGTICKGETKDLASQYKRVNDREKIAIMKPYQLDWFLDSYYCSAEQNDRN